MALVRKRFVDIISSLEYEDLVELQSDLFDGATEIRQIVSHKIKQIKATESRTCAMCGSGVNLRVANEFTLIFGPPNSKKRAFFCAIDCMEYFTNNLKRLSTKKIQSQH